MVPTLQEILLLLAGHASSWFVIAETPAPKQAPWSWTIRLSSTGITLSHPGDRAILDSLAGLSAKHRRVKAFALDVRRRAHNQVVRAAREKEKAVDWQNTALAHLAGQLLEIVKEYETSIETIEHDILSQSWDIGQQDSMDKEDDKFASISLAQLRARVEEWTAPLFALDALVTTLLQGPQGALPTSLDSRAAIEQHFIPESPPRCPRWATGLLLDLLDERAKTSVGRVHQCISQLVKCVEDVWRGTLIAWMCYGRSCIDSDSAFGSAEDPLVEWVGRDDVANEAEALSASILASATLPKLAMAGENGNMNPHFSSPRWRFVSHALPDWIASDASTSEGILFVGRSIAKVHTHAKRLSGASSRSRRGERSFTIPASLSGAHAILLNKDDTRPCSHREAFRAAVKTIQDSIGEWIWRNILPHETVYDAFDTLGGYFLHRDGLFVTVFLERLTELRKSKLMGARSASAGVIQVADIELAMQRSRIDLETSDSTSALDRCAIHIPESPRGKAQAREASWKEDPKRTNVHFNSIALGVPFTLSYQAQFPLDLILTASELRLYSDLFSYLLALSAVRARLCDSWVSISQAQRARRRFTGTREGGEDRAEERARRRLLRKALSIAREGMWFLNVLGGHFQTDVIDVHFTRLMDQLQTLRPSTKLGIGLDDHPSSAHPEASVDRWRQKVGQSVRRVSSMQVLQEIESGQSGAINPPSRRHVQHAKPLARKIGRSSVIAKSVYGGTSQASNQGQARVVAHPTTNRTKDGISLVSKDKAVNFATLRLSHQECLANIVEGLLLTRSDAWRCVGQVLQTCLRFTAMVDRWGGDVLPPLLSGGTIDDEDCLPNDARGEFSFGKRKELLEEIATVLQKHLDSFFVILSQASSDKSINTGGSVQSTNHEQVPQGFQQASVRLTPTCSPHRQQDAARLAAWRQHEQLLLRLDYNGFVSRRFASDQSELDA